MSIKRILRTAMLCTMMLALPACGSRNVKMEDDREISETERKQAGQMEQMLQRSLQQQKQNMERLRQMQGQSQQPQKTPAQQPQGQ